MPENVSLDLDEAEMRRLGTRVVNLVAEHLATLSEQPTTAMLTRDAAERLLHGEPPEERATFDELLVTLRERVLPYHTREPHPGFMGYVPSAPAYPGVLGDWIAAGFNIFAGAWYVGSGAAQVELTVLDWFRSWLGMPSGAGGILVSGGSSANFTALAAARHRLVGEDASLLPRLTVYASDQVHSSVVRAAWLAGVPRPQVRLLPTDDAYRLRLEALDALIARDRMDGFVPLMVVANGVSTNTGAIDPLAAVADLCAREGVWMHVDAAFGGFAALTERGSAALAGIGRADSVTLDPHKWLFVPFECGCLLVREPQRLFEAFHIMPEYMRDREGYTGAVDFADYGEQLTRYARALKVWLVVRYYGLSTLRAAIDGGIDRALYAEELVRAASGLELLAPTGLGVCCFRAHPPGMDDPEELDALNARINEMVNAGRRYFISSTRLRGRYALRVCPIGHRTTRGDIDGLLADVLRLSGD